MKVFQPCLKQVQTVVGSILPCLENERLEIILNINVTKKYSISSIWYFL